jgi:hypothetical protein
VTGHVRDLSHINAGVRPRVTESALPPALLWNFL